MQIDKIQKYTALCVVLVPFLQYYGYGFLNGSFCIILFLFIYIWKKQRYIAFANVKPMFWYIIYYCFMRFFYGLSTGSIIAPSIIFMFLYWSFLNRNLCFDIFIRYYRLIAFVNIGFFVVQELMYQKTGYRMVGILTFLPTTLGKGELDMSEFSAQVAESDRSSAFFSEPAHFVQFLLPLLAIELLYFGDKKAFFRSSVYVLTLIGLASGNALLGLLVVFLFFFIKQLKKRNPIVATFIIALCMSTAVYSVNYIMNTEYGEKLMARQDQLSSDQLRASSGFLRIYRGYYVYDEMNNIQKFVGVNSTDAVDELINKCAVNSWFRENDRYFNTFQSLLIYTGYIGIFLFYFGFFALCRRNNLAGICCVFLFIALSFIASIYFSYTMVLYMVCAMLMRKKTCNQELVRFAI